MDLAYPPRNFERQKNGTKINYNVQNKQMSVVEYNKLSKEIILASVKHIKPLLHKYLGIKSFMLTRIKVSRILCTLSELIVFTPNM